MLLIVGLGNKGFSYRNTFHNMGFMVADKLVKELGLKFKYTKCLAKVASNEKIIIAKPQTYMNLSGKCVKCLLDDYKLKPKDMLVVYDDIDLPKGELRIRERGSAGTHNGMRNIISTIENTDFVRVRIGIGRPPEGQDMAKYVLSRLSPIDKEMIQPTIDKAAKCIIDYISNSDIQMMIRASK